MQLPDHILISDLNQLLQSQIELSSTQIATTERAAKFLDDKLASNQVFYGINTGFGSLCHVRIDDGELSKLQENLVVSHACGIGDEVPEEIVRLMLLLKINNIIQGHSGIRIATLERLLFFYNNHITPVVFQQGSLGASGDLAPLAHLALPLLGKGFVYWNGHKVASKEVLDYFNIEPLKLHAKEGLGLLNGTQFMSAYGCWCMMKANRLLDWADCIAAMSLDAFDGLKQPFLPQIHQARPHRGQLETARTILNLLSESKLQNATKTQVQDPYSFRCIPQVHGATKDAVSHINEILEIEINAATDNPLLFVEDDLILSGGNFHGQPLAINLDYFAIAMSEIASIAERRTYLLISGQRDLPPFLTMHPGVNSGFMIVQYTAAAIVSENKQLCTPASVDSIVSSNGQEDHVSMGANAATQLYRIIKNVQKVLAIELLCAAQALDFRHPNTSSPQIEMLHKKFRTFVSFNDNDRIMHDDILSTTDFLNRDSRELINL